MFSSDRLATRRTLLKLYSGVLNLPLAYVVSLNKRNKIKPPKNTDGLSNKIIHHRHRDGREEITRATSSRIRTPAWTRAPCSLLWAIRTNALTIRKQPRRTGRVLRRVRCQLHVVWRTAGEIDFPVYLRATCPVWCRQARRGPPSPQSREHT